MEIQKQNIDKIVKNTYNDEELIVEWKYTLISMKKDVLKTKDLTKNNRKEVIEMLSNMQKQKNPVLIRSLTSNNYFQKYHHKTHLDLKKIP